MKRLSALLILLSAIVLPVAAGTADGSSETNAIPKKYTLTRKEYKTLMVIDMDQKPIRNISYKRTMDASKDEFLGLYVREETGDYYYVVRPLGGKPIKIISWRRAKGARHFMALEGRTVAEFFRDAQNAQKDRQKLEQEWRKLEQQYAGIQIDAPLPKANANALYAKWSARDGVSATYISKAMLKMIQGIPQIELDKPVDLTPVIQTLDGLYMLEFADNGWNQARNTAIGGLRKDIQDFLAGNGYQRLMEKRKGEQFTRLYSTGDGKIVKGFVLVRMDADFNYGQFICIEGDIPQAEFERLISNAM